MKQNIPSQQTHRRVCGVSFQPFANVTQHKHYPSLPLFCVQVIHWSKLAPIRFKGSIWDVPAHAWPEVDQAVFDLIEACFCQNPLYKVSF
jgi:hypothetical protein